jgi:hypothetical protein
MYAFRQDLFQILRVIKSKIQQRIHWVVDFNLAERGMP